MHGTRRAVLRAQHRDRLADESLGHCVQMVKMRTHSAAFRPRAGAGPRSQLAEGGGRRNDEDFVEGADRLVAGHHQGRTMSPCPAQKTCPVSPRFVAGRALGLCEAPHRIPERDRMHL